MKKLNKLFIIMILIFGINNVKADETDEYYIFCQYGDYYFKYSGFNSTDVFEFDTNFDELGISIEEGRPGKTIYSYETDKNGVKYQPEIKWLQEKKLLNDSGEFTCPRNPFGSDLGESTYKECGKSGCSFVNNVEKPSESLTCNYTSNKGNKITINYELNETYINGKYDVTYPDGSKKTFIGTEVNGNFMPSNTCNDIYYIAKDKLIKMATYANKDVTTNNTLSGLCRTYNISEIEHYCVGICQYEEMTCPTNDYNTVSCGSSSDIPAALPTFIHNIIDIIKISVPVILIILGMIDFAKATISQDEKQMKDSQTKFIKRAIAAVAIFVVVAVTQLLFKMIGTNSTNEMVSCINCFINNNCGAGSSELRSSDSSYTDDSKDTSSSDVSHGGSSRRG